MADSYKMEDVKKTLQNYKERSETGNCMKLTPFVKCAEACGLKEYKTNIEASCWAKMQDKSKKIDIDKIAGPLIDTIAQDVVQKKCKEKAPRATTDPEVEACAHQIRKKIAQKACETPDGKKATKVDAATARLTDASGYTGSHKERFDEDGKGKGIKGRVDAVNTSGYTQSYKNEGTYGAKK